MRYMPRTRAPSRPLSCCIVSFETSSPSKRISYIRRATASRERVFETSAACRCRSADEWVSGEPNAYMRTPRSPTQMTVVPFSPIVVIARCVTVVPGPSMSTFSDAAGTYTVPSSSTTVMALSARLMVQRSK